MNKVIEALYNLAANGDDQAAKHLSNMWDMGGDQLAQYVAQNDSALQEILGLNLSVMANPPQELKDIQDAYYALRNTGVTAYTGDKKTDIYGRPMHSLDEFMSEFGMAPSDNYSIEDDDRAFFTNPNHPNYWKNRPENERAAIARKMGYADVREFDDYLDRAAKDFQHRNRVEGYDENNDWHTIPLLKSAAKGFLTPRSKEAELAGRPFNPRDLVGDIAENGLALIPGFGTTRLITKGAARLPAGKLATTVAEKAAPAVGATVDQVAQPVLSQLMDSQVLYKNGMPWGTPEDTLNLRSEFSPKEVAGQVGGIIGAKSAIKGGAGMAKNFLETRYGNKAGGQGFRNFLGIVENVNEKTDDLIARRQAVLDRKAELAKQTKNVSLPGDKDIPTGSSKVSDIGAAENFRILNQEAERLAKSEKAREAYRDAIAKDRAFERFDEMEAGVYEPLEKIGQIIPDNFPVNPENTIGIRLGNGVQLAVPKGIDQDVLDGALNRYRFKMDELERFKSTRAGRDANTAMADESYSPEKAIRDYMTANESTPYRGHLVLLPDGNIAREEWYKGAINGEHRIQYPGADYEVKFTEKPKPLRYQYEKLNDPELNYNIKPLPDELSRNVVVRDKILQDDLLQRKLNPLTNRWVERGRDVVANDIFNAMAREGVGIASNAMDLRGKRERARWNSMLGKLRELTAKPEIPIEERRRNADAIMNVMQYGLDGLPVELYSADPETYRKIANNLGVSNWKHFSEREIQPTNSSSRAD